MTLEQLNTLSVPGARQWFSQACAAKSWISMMVENRPYADKQQLLEHAERYWQKMQKNDYLEAFAAHPMIGDFSAFKTSDDAFLQHSAYEQQQAAAARDDTLQALKQLNSAYLKKHGFIFIVYAKGLSAETLLQQLQSRLENTTDTEITNAAQHQLDIALSRINANLGASPTV